MQSYQKNRKNYDARMTYHKYLELLSDAWDTKNNKSFDKTDCPIFNYYNSIV